jgi:hypothetical protein
VAGYEGVDAVRIFAAAFVFGFSFFINFGFAVPVAAAGTPLTICNRTSMPVEDVAVGYHSSGVNDAAGSRILTGPFVSIGWVGEIAPGRCQNFANPFGARYMFWWGAVSNGINFARTVWPVDGDDHFCIPNIYGSGSQEADMTKTFTFEDQNASEVACESGSTNPKVGPNLWVRVRKVDLDVNPIVDFSGT